MILELTKAIDDVIDSNTKRVKEIESNFETWKNDPAVSREDLLEIVAEHKRKKQIVIDGVSDRNAYIEAYENYKKDRTFKKELTEVEDNLAKKYGVVITRTNAKSTTTKRKTNKKKNKKGNVKGFIAGALAGAVLFTGGYHLAKYSKKNDNTKDQPTRSAIETTMPNPTEKPMETSNGLILVTPKPEKTPEATVAPTATPVVTATPAPTAEPTLAPTATPVAEAIDEVVAELPFEEYGQFTNVNDMEQVNRRAQWYYNNYLSQFNTTAVTNQTLNPENIANDLRMINGQFRLDSNGYTDYNRNYIIDTAKDVHTLLNYGSFTYLGNEVVYLPIAPLFADGSLAQVGALQIDAVMQKLCAAIREDNIDEFSAAAYEWMDIFVNTCYHFDFDPNYVNIYQIPDPSGFDLYHAMTAQYVAYIDEFQRTHHLSLCYDLCTNYTTEETEKVPFSEIVYMVDELPMNDIANRSGHRDEYAENNYSLPENLFLSAANYFENKLELEKGNQPRLG